MIMRQKRVELLAPAGNYEGFLGALRAGADAVYLGGEKYGARAYADNFTGEEICRAVSYAHLFGRKVYLTVNTLLKDEELAGLPDYLAPFYEAGLDGVIVQDMGAFLLIREVFPALKLHVSTQMTVTGTCAAGRLKALGAVRIVPARELSLAEIETMKRNTGLELETFVHGAMCYCYSGQCLFSSLLGGRSGNRGRCAQPCRLPYKMAESRFSTGECYPLSLKDLCSISFLPKLIDAGIDSFKIEGRMKKPEYAAGVTAVYRKYIDLYYEKGAAGYAVEQADMDNLSGLYVRTGTQDGYYFKRNGAEMVTLASPAYNGGSEEQLARIRHQYLEEPLKKSIKMKAVFQIGEKAALTLTAAGQEASAVTVTGRIVEKANKQPITAENIKISLSKLGNTFFTAQEKDICVELSADAFYPLKEINELRRQGADALLRALCGGQAQVQAEEKQALRRAKEAAAKPSQEESFKTSSEVSAKPLLRILVSAKEQLKTVLDTELSPDILYLESDMPLTPDDMEGIKRKLAKKGQDALVFLALPHIVREGDMPVLAGMLPLLAAADGALVRNMETLCWLKKAGYQGRIRTDAGVYCFNKKSLRFFLEEAEGCCLPYELNRKEGRVLTAGMETGRLEKAVYGRIPLMITANCIAKTNGRCVKSMEGAGAAAQQPQILRLKDRYQKEFPVIMHCRHCYNVIYNTVPLSLHGMVAEGHVPMPLRLDFTVETGRETEEILRFFAKALEGTLAQPPYEAYTLGHEKRGVE